jgi:hypothetical protein
LRSKSTSSLPFAGSRSWRSATTAPARTVESTADWKVSTGGMPSSRPLRSAAPIAAASSRVKRWESRPPFTGNELYLNGLNSGSVSSQAARTNAGMKAGRAARPEKRAKPVMPIIGERRTSWSGMGRPGRSSASSA